MKTMKKLLAVLMMIVMVVSFAPTAFAGILPGYYYIWIGDTQVTDRNKNDVYGDGTIKFDPETYTLTLTDAFIHASGIRCAGITVGSSLDSTDPVKKLNIKLVGKSYIYGKDDPTSNNICAGINCYYCNELNFTGDGTLTVKGYDSQGYKAAGIYGSQSTTVNVESGTVTIVGKNFKYYTFTDECKVKENKDNFVVTHKEPKADSFFTRMFTAIKDFFISVGNFFKNLFK